MYVRVYGMYVLFMLCMRDKYVGCLCMCAMSCLYARILSMYVCVVCHVSMCGMYLSMHVCLVWMCVCYVMHVSVCYVCVYVCMHEMLCM